MSCTKPISSRHYSDIRYLLVLCTALLTAASAGAQSQRIAVVEHNPQQHAADCSNAARFLMRGIPVPQQRWAHETILGCSREAPAALAAAIRRLAASHDTSALAPFVQSARYVLDDRLFDAGLEVATQSSASAEARAAGFLIAAMEATDRLDFTLSDIVASPEPIVGCVGALFDHSVRSSASTPLAPNSGVRLRNAVAAALAAPGTPLPVRNAALCVGPSARALP